MGALIGRAVVGAPAVAFALSLRLRRRVENDVVGGDWTATPEVFQDLTSDRIMRAWLDAAGGRHYVAEK